MTGDKLSYFVCVPCQSRSFEIDILVESPCPQDNHKSWILRRRVAATGFNRFLAVPTCLFMVKCVRDSVKNRPAKTLVNGQAAEQEACNVQMSIWTTYCIFSIWLNNNSCLLLESIGFAICLNCTAWYCWVNKTVFHIITTPDTTSMLMLQIVRKEIVKLHCKK